MADHPEVGRATKPDQSTVGGEDDETPLVLLDLPFAVDVDNSFAREYPVGRPSHIFDNLLGGAENLARRTLEAQPRRVHNSTVPEHARKTESTADENRMARPQPLQPIEIRLLGAPYTNLRPQLNQHPSVLTESPVFRGEVKPEGGLLLRVRRPKRHRRTPDEGEGAPNSAAASEVRVEVVGEVARSVSFHTPADPCFLPDADSVAKSSVAAKPWGGSEATRANLTPLQQVRAGLRRSVIGAPAAFVMESTPASVSYAFRDGEIVKTVAPRALTINSSDPVPVGPSRESTHWMELFGHTQSAGPIVTKLLQDRPIWPVDDLTAAAMAAGSRRPDTNRHVIRALTYRVVGGCLDRLVIRLGFDFRAEANREVVASHQRIYFRVPHAQRRFVHAVARSPDIEDVLQRLLNAASSEEPSSPSPLALFVRLLRLRSVSAVLLVDDIRGCSLAALLLREGTSDTFTDRGGWFTETTLRRATAAVAEAFHQFLLQDVAPNLKSLPDSMKARQATAALHRAAGAQTVAASGIDSLWDDMPPPSAPLQQPTPHQSSSGGDDAVTRALDAAEYNVASESDDAASALGGVSDEDSHDEASELNSDGGSETGMFMHASSTTVGAGVNNASPTADAAQSFDAQDLLGDWDVGGFV